MCSGRNHFEAYLLIALVRRSWKDVPPGGSCVSMPPNIQCSTAPAVERRQVSLEAPVLVTLLLWWKQVYKDSKFKDSVIVFQRFIDPEFKS